MSDGALLSEIKDYSEMSVPNLLNMLNRMIRESKGENYNIPLSFWMDAQERGLKIQNIHINKIKNCLDSLKESLLVNVPTIFSQITNKIRDIPIKIQENIQKSQEDKSLDLFNEIINKVQFCFLKYSSKEFENIIHSYFNQVSFKQKSVNIIEDSIKPIETLIEGNEGVHYIYNYSLYIHKKGIKKILNYFISNHFGAELFFTILYFSRPKIYFDFVNVIFYESFFRRVEFIKILPKYDLDLEKCELNEEILCAIFERKQVHRRCILEYLNVRTKKRHILINILVKFYSLIDIRSYDFLVLNFEENQKICEANESHIYLTYENKELFSQKISKEDVLTSIYNFICKKDEEFVIKFLLFFKNEEDPDYIQILKNFLEIKKLDKKILQFLVENFILNQKLFFFIAYHMEKESIIRYLEIFLKEEASLINFLCILTPFEIYLNIHYFKETSNSVKASQLINEKKDIFNHEVAQSVIEKLFDGKLPSIFMRTVILTYLNFPKLHRFIIKLMYKLVKLEIWKNPTLSEGFIKMLSLLGNYSIDIILSLPNDFMRYLLFKDDKIRICCWEYLKIHHKNLRGRKADVFKAIVYSQCKAKINK